MENFKQLKKTIGHKYNDIFYTYGQPTTWDPERLLLNPKPYPAYILRKDNDVKIIESYFNQDGSSSKLTSIIVEGAIRYIRNNEVLKLLKKGYELVLHLSSIEGVEEIYSLVENDKYNYKEAKQGDEIALMECGFIVATGKVIGQINIEGKGTELLEDYYKSYKVLFTPSVSGYSVTGIDWFQNEDVKTSTDIGGHYLAINKNGQWLKMAHLHNGFGDGNYTLRFRGDKLIR